MHLASTVLAEDAENLAEVDQMVLRFSGLDDHIVDVNLHSPPELCLKHLGHQPLVCRPCVLQPEGHHLITVGAPGCDEGCLFLVRYEQRYLVVSSVSVEETHTVVSGSGVNELVDLRKGETILGTGCIEVNEVHADPSLPCLLFDHQCVG